MTSTAVNNKENKELQDEVALGAAATLARQQVLVMVFQDDEDTTTEDEGKAALTTASARGNDKAADNDEKKRAALPRISSRAELKSEPTSKEDKENESTTKIPAMTAAANMKHPSGLVVAGAATAVGIPASKMSEEEMMDKDSKSKTVGATVAAAAVATAPASKNSVLLEMTDKDAKSKMSSAEEDALLAVKAGAGGELLIGKGVSMNTTTLRRCSHSGIPRVSRIGAVAVAPGQSLESAELYSSGRLTPSTSLVLSFGDLSGSDMSLDLAAATDSPASTTSDDSGLAEAQPVDEEGDAHISSADPLAHGKKFRTSATLDLESSKPPLRKPVVIVLAITAVVCGIILAIVFSMSNGSSSDSSNDSAPSAAEASAASLPTSAPTSFFANVISLPESTIAVIANPSTPQAEAYNWLINDPNRFNYSDWRAVQRFALTTLYFSMSGERWSLNKHWLDYDKDECTDWFFRVPIDSENEWAFRRRQLQEQQADNDTASNITSACDSMGHYTTLILSVNNLEGFIPAEIGLLTKLEFLDLSANDGLGRAIPSEIGLLTELRRLSVDRNMHTSIPSEIGVLPKVETIYLEHNPFDGPIPTEIGNLGASMQSLSLQRSGFTGYLPTELYKLTKLRELHVQNILGLTGGTMEGIGALTDLESFLAHDVPFNSTIPSEVGLLTNLHSFNVWNTKVYGSLPTEYWQMTNLKNMDIDDNFLTGTFPEDMGKFSHLESVWINGNSFSGTFPPQIWSYLKNLTYLKMSGNSVTGTIPTEVALMTSMKKIWFADMDLVGTIPSEIGGMEALEEIFLHMTNLEGTIPIGLENLANLELITLSNTSITGAVPDSLCDDLKNMEISCLVVLGVQEQVCTEIEVKNFTCLSSMLCGCDCDPCL